VAAMDPATHFVDVGETLALGIASLREHRAYIDGLGRDFDPEEWLTNMAGYAGMAAGCDYAVLLRQLNV
ncbi:MAG TPA: PIG-L family deacetylase, partial [Acidimicrobiia bacterium]|nr:PIG-L family deacetylase [Acidimicrobiia bacterium]